MIKPLVASVSPLRMSQFVGRRHLAHGLCGIGINRCSATSFVPKQVGLQKLLLNSHIPRGASHADALPLNSSANNAAMGMKSRLEYLRHSDADTGNGGGRIQVYHDLSKLQLHRIEEGPSGLVRRWLKWGQVNSGSRKNRCADHDLG